jgi:drug/metabolite transporter (DMT)-like permease
MMINLLLLTVVVVAGAMGEVFATQAMKRVGEIHTLRPGRLLRLFGKGMGQRRFAVGLLLMAVSFFAYLVLLARTELSFAVPATALGYVVESLAARSMLGEQISGRRWAGIVVVCVGVAMVTAG